MPGVGSYQSSSGADIHAAMTSSSPLRRHTTWGQSHLPPRTKIILPDPPITLVMMGSPGGIASSRNVMRNLLSYSTSARRIGGDSSVLISRSKPDWQGRGGGARDASHPKRSPRLGCPCFSLPYRLILRGVQRTFAPASNRVRALEAGSESHTRWTIRSKLSLRRPACARVEPHGCGEMYRRIRRTIASCISRSVTVVERLSAARIKVPGGAGTEKRPRYVLTWMSCVQAIVHI